MFFNIYQHKIVTLTIIEEHYTYFHTLTNTSVIVNEGLFSLMILILQKMSPTKGRGVQ